MFLPIFRANLAKRPGREGTFKTVSDWVELPRKPRATGAIRS
jgi:hypothetical protein